MIIIIIFSFLLSGCAMLSALSGISGAISPKNSGTQVTTKAHFGHKKSQNSAGGAVKLQNNTGKVVGRDIHKKVESKHNSGTISGRDHHHYKAKKVFVQNSGLDMKEIFLFLGIIIAVIIAHRVPWKFWKK